MSITIKRKTGWMGMATNIHIKLNGEKVAKVANNSHIEVQLPKEKAYLRVTHGGVKSNEIEVKEGDFIEIKQRFWYKWSNLFYIIMLFLSILIPNHNYRIGLIIVSGILMILCMFIFNGYYLEIVDEKEEDDLLL